MEVALVVMSGLAAIWFLACFCYRPHSWAKSVVKTVAVGGLAVAVMIGGGPVLLWLGLILGAVGDFCLSRPGQRAFLLGLVAFALAHLAYLALMLAMGAKMAVTPATMAVMVAALGMGLLLFRRAGDLRWPVAGYVAVIAAMAVAALGLPDVRWLGTLAALSFVLSDAILGLEMFVLPAAHPARKITPFGVWTTYWLAQMLFLVSLGGLWLL
jgi:uncharacterized membrane protein YhhN